MSVLGSSSLTLPRQRSPRQPPSVDVARHLISDEESTVNREDVRVTALVSWQPVKGGFDESWTDDTEAEADTDSTATSPCSLTDLYNAITNSANSSPSPRRRTQQENHAFVFTSPKLVRKKSTPSLPSQFSEPQIPETDVQRPSTSGGGSRARTGQARDGRGRPSQSGARDAAGKVSNPRLARVMHQPHGSRTPCRNGQYSSCSSAESDFGALSRTASPAYFHQPYIPHAVGPSHPAQALMPHARPVTPAHHMGVFPPAAASMPMASFPTHNHPQQHGHGQSYSSHPQQHLYAQRASMQQAPQTWPAGPLIPHQPTQAQYPPHAAVHGVAAGPVFGVTMQPVAPAASAINSCNGAGNSNGSGSKSTSHASASAASTSPTSFGKAKKQAKKASRRRRKSKTKASRGQSSEKGTGAAAALDSQSNGMYRSSLSLDEINIALPGWMCTDVCGIKKKKTRRGCRGHRRNRKKKQEQEQEQEQQQEQELQEHEGQQAQHEEQQEQVLQQFLQEVQHAEQLLQVHEVKQAGEYVQQQKQQHLQVADDEEQAHGKEQQAHATLQQPQPMQDSHRPRSVVSQEPECDPWNDWFSDDVAHAKAALIPTKRAESIEEFRTLSTSDPNVTQQKLDDICNNITYLPHELGLKP